MTFCQSVCLENVTSASILLIRRQLRNPTYPTIPSSSGITTAAMK